MAKACSLKPDVVLVNLEMSDMAGAKIIRTLRRNFPRLGIIAFTSLDSISDTEAALGAAADELVCKSDLMTHLVPTILALTKNRSSNDPTSRN